MVFADWQPTDGRIIHAWADTIALRERSRPAVPPSDSVRFENTGSAAVARVGPPLNA
jgi:hypothetical protein